jgi:hypothetical protein
MTAGHHDNEAESLLGELPGDIRDRLPKSKKVRTRLTALARLGACSSSIPSVSRAQQETVVRRAVRCLVRI